MSIPFTYLSQMQIDIIALEVPEQYFLGQEIGMEIGSLFRNVKLSQDAGRSKKPSNTHSRGYYF